MRTSENKQTTNFRARVMKYAWSLWRSAAVKTWRECMKRAWSLYYLAKRMREGIVTFNYRKVDGTIRQACGTLKDLPAGATINGKRLTKPSYKTFSYFDTEKNEFRCFKVENLISVAI